MNNSNWVKYQNGNYFVSLNLDSGSKIRENDLDFFDAEFPESADVKITNKCTNPCGNGANCAFCHEGSSPKGKQSDALHSPVWDTFHPYSEVALGGGNVLEYQDLVPLLERLKNLKLIANITLNQNHFEHSFDFVKELVDKKLVYGVGVSLNHATPELIEKMEQIPNGVIHVINGIVTMADLMTLANHNLKILILGYKTVRRGKNLYQSNVGYAIDKRKTLLYNKLEEILNDHWFNVVSFDNLAIKQLKPQRLVSKEFWNVAYMGEDYNAMTSASMYIDLVENEFACNSCDVNNRYKIENKTVTQMYQFLKEKYNG